MSVHALVGRQRLNKHSFWRCECGHMKYKHRYDAYKISHAYTKCAECSCELFLRGKGDTWGKKA